MANLLLLFIIFLLTASLTMLLVAPCYIGGVIGLILHYGPQNAEYFFQPYYLVTSYAKLINYWLRYHEVLGTGFILTLALPPLIGILFSIFILRTVQRLIRKLLGAQMAFSARMRNAAGTPPDSGQAVTIEGEYKVVDVQPPTKEN